MRLGDRVIGYDEAAGVMDRGADVGEWQQLLIRLGEKVVVDDVFGPDTRTATIRVQRLVGVTPDGLVGPATLRAARAYKPPPAVPEHDLEVVIRYGLDGDPNGPDRDAAVMLGDARGHGFAVRLAADPVRELVRITVGYPDETAHEEIVGRGRLHTRQLVSDRIRSATWAGQVRQLGRERAGRR